MKAFKGGEWNAYTVEAVGDRIRTWVNDVPVSDVVDGLDRSGSIARASSGCRSTPPRRPVSRCAGATSG
jgi:hypothetical protein